MLVVPRWALFSASTAPVLLIGGWTVSAGRQPGGFDQARDTISALAAVGATDRWIMTAALVGLGICHCVTALGLRTAPRTGRVLLGLGGVATVAAATFPLPATGGSTAHAVAASVAFVALALWPGWAPHLTLPAWWRPATAALLLGLVAWFAVELTTGGARIGLAERVAAGAEAFCPLTVLVAGRTSLARRTTTGRDSGPPVSRRPAVSRWSRWSWWSRLISRR